MRLRSIEQKIFLLILLICLAPAVLFVLLLGVGSRLTFEETIGLELTHRAEYLADCLDRFLTGRAGELAGLIQTAGADPRRLAVAAADKGLADAVIGIEPGGKRQIFAAPGQDLDWARLLAADPRLRLWTERVGPGQPAPGQVCYLDLALNPPGRPVHALVFIFGAGERRLAMVCRSAPLIHQFTRQLSQIPDTYLIYSKDNSVIYPEAGVDGITVQWIRQFMQSRDGAGNYFTVQSRNRSFLIAPAASQIMRRVSGPDEPAAQWFILLQYDRETYLGSLDKYLWLSIVLTLGMALAMLGLSWLAARQIIGPLISLRRQAEELARGNLDVRASVRTRDEIGDLAEAFNTMAGRLRAIYGALEERLEENEQRARHINVINEITSAIIQTLSLDSIFEILARELGKILPYDALWIALYDGGGKDLKVSHITPGRLLSLFERGRIPFEGSLHGHVIESRETTHAELGPPRADGLFETRRVLFETRVLGAQGFQSYLIAPLPARTRVIGAMTVVSTAPDAFSARLTPMMRSLAGAVAIAIEQTELFERISRFAADLERKVAERTRELEAATQKLIQTEKYAATGRMAGNLAHEINNPLGIIKNYLQLVKNNLKAAEGGRRSTDPGLGNIEVIDEEVGRIARMVRRMLDLHRPVEQAVQPVDVNALIGEILTLMGEDLEGGHIQVTRELAAELPRPIASPDLMRQVLINLIRNAQDAMEGGGALSIRTSAIVGWENGAERQVVRVRVADTGCGIPPERLSQIFDPFFTTKSPDKGTGLGLCVSYGIVRMYGGTIDVESEVGQGTSLTVTLPAGPPEEEAAGPLGEEAAGPQGEEAAGLGPPEAPAEAESSPDADPARSA